MLLAVRNEGGGERRVKGLMWHKVWNCGNKRICAYEEGVRISDM
jgi:hypothetical protein